MLAHLDQIDVSLRPQTVRAVEIDLRIFACFVLDHDPALSCVADIDRSHIEAFKLWQQAQRGMGGRPGQVLHRPASHRDAAHVLRADHRVGLVRCTDAGADLLR